MPLCHRRVVTLHTRSLETDNSPARDSGVTRFSPDFLFGSGSRASFELRSASVNASSPCRDERHLVSSYSSMLHALKQEGYCRFCKCEALTSSDELEAMREEIATETGRCLHAEQIPRIELRWGPTSKDSTRRLWHTSPIFST